MPTAQGNCGQGQLPPQFLFCPSADPEDTISFTTFEVNNMPAASFHVKQISVEADIMFSDCSSRDPWEGQAIYKSRRCTLPPQSRRLQSRVQPTVYPFLSPHCTKLVSYQHKGGDDAAAWQAQPDHVCCLWLCRECDRGQEVWGGRPVLPPCRNTPVRRCHIYCDPCPDSWEPGGPPAAHFQPPSLKWL